MSNDELKKKIVAVLDTKQTHGISQRRVSDDGPIQFLRVIMPNEHIADALIAAGIGDVKEAEHRAEVAERALRNAAPRLNCRGGIGKGFCKVDECEYYHCNNDEGCIKVHLEQAEKELAEERKDD